MCIRVELFVLVHNDGDGQVNDGQKWVELQSDSLSSFGPHNENVHRTALPYPSCPMSDGEFEVVGRAVECEYGK